MNIVSDLLVAAPRDAAADDRNDKQDGYQDAQQRCSAALLIPHVLSGTAVAHARALAKVFAAIVCQPSDLNRTTSVHKMVVAHCLGAAIPRLGSVKITEAGCTKPEAPTESAPQ